MSDIFADTLKAADDFDIAYTIFPSDPRQVAWNLSMAAFAQTKFIVAGPDFKKMFYAAYQACNVSLLSLLEYVSELRRDLKEGAGDALRDENIEHTAIKIQQHMPTLSKGFVPTDFKRTCEALAAQCEAICKHYDAHRQAEEKERRGTF